jgi:hypothetical protein
MNRKGVDMVVELIKQGVYLSNPPQTLIYMLVYAARYVSAEEAAPDWVKLLAGGNPELGEDLLDEVRRWEQVEGMESNVVPFLRKTATELRLVHVETGRVATVHWSDARWWEDSGWDIYIMQGDAQLAYLFKHLGSTQILKYLYARGYVVA